MVRPALGFAESRAARETDARPNSHVRVDPRSAEHEAVNCNLNPLKALAMLVLASERVAAFHHLNLKMSSHQSRPLCGIVSSPFLSALSRRTSEAVASGSIGGSKPLNVDVAVIGGGPAGYAMSAVLHGTHGHSVALVDPSPDGAWPNNYGSWHIEWEALSRRLDMPELMTSCIRKEWPITDCFFGGSWGMEWEQLLRLDRRYLQVDRKGLKAAFLAKFGDGVTILPTLLKAKRIAPNLFDENLVHDATGSTLQLADGTSVRAKIVIDASGFESKLVAREIDALAGLSKPLRPGYQIAYGFSCDIEGDSIAPYDTGAMTLFDYRTDHLEAACAEVTSSAMLLQEAREMLQDAEDRPSFVYVMPDGPTGDGYTRAFFEETSLVGRDERRLEFGTLKKRAFIRLKHLGLKVREGSVGEEEYCYIPMGGNLPDPSQRIIATGGAAAVVHPSTGYQLCRMLAATTDLATAISSGLRKDASPDEVASDAYRALWPPQQRFQRDFQVFGGEFLGSLPVEKLRGFFDAFFKLEPDVWGGFLAGRSGLPGNEYHDDYQKRFLFGLKILVNFPPAVAISLITYAVSYSVEYGTTNLLRSFFTPLFGSDSFPSLEPKPLDASVVETYQTGDTAAKREALEMLRSPDGNGEASPQVAELEEEEAAKSGR